MTRGKYERLIDREIWAFIGRTNAWYPPETIDFPIERQRAIYNAMCRAFRRGYPAGVGATDSAIDAADRMIPIRHYRCADTVPTAAVVYYHGGGFILGGLDSHDDVCAELCAGTGYDVWSVDYRLAPEHPHPAAVDDACTAFEQLAARINLPIVLCGESAGGALAAAVAQATRSHHHAAIGQVLIYPSLGGDVERGSYVAHADAPMLSLRDVLYYRGIRTDGRDSADDPTIAPLADEDFSALPPTIIITAQCDPLSSDGEAYRDRIVAAGGRAWWREEPGLVHSFVRARHASARARAGFDHIVSAVAALGQRAWPY